MTNTSFFLRATSKTVSPSLEQSFLQSMKQYKLTLDALQLILYVSTHVFVPVIGSYRVLRLVAFGRSVDDTDELLELLLKLCQRVDARSKMGEAA